MKITSQTQWLTVPKSNDTRQKVYRGKFTRDDIRLLAQQTSNSVKKTGYKGKLQVTVVFPSGKFWSAKGTPVGAKVNVYKMHQHYDEDHDKYEADPKFYSKFVLYVYKE